MRRTEYQCKDCPAPLANRYARRYVEHDNRCPACETRYRQELVTKEDSLPFPKLRAKLIAEAERQAHKERSAWVWRTTQRPFGGLSDICVYEDTQGDRIVAMVFRTGKHPEYRDASWEILYPLSEFWVRSFAGTAQGDKA